MLQISFVGIGVNGYCFYKMWGRERYRTIFHLLNRTRMISNCVILAVFLIWVIPSTAMWVLLLRIEHYEFRNRTYLPHIFNQLFGQLAGWGAYWMGPSTQTFISVTRFIAAYFPFFYRNIEGAKSATVGIIEARKDQEPFRFSLFSVWSTVLFSSAWECLVSTETIHIFSWNPEHVLFFFWNRYLTLKLEGSRWKQELHRLKTSS